MWVFCLQRLLRLTQPTSDWVSAPEKIKRKKAENGKAVMTSAFGGGDAVEMQAPAEKSPYDNPGYDVTDPSQVSADVP